MPGCGPGRRSRCECHRTRRVAFCGVRVGSRLYTIEPNVNADFGAYVRPIPIPESHHVSVGLTVRSAVEEAVCAWRTACLRENHGGGTGRRPASPWRALASSGDRSFHFALGVTGGQPAAPAD